MPHPAITISAAVTAVVLFISCTAIGTIAIGDQAAVGCAPPKDATNPPSLTQPGAPPGRYPRIGRWDSTQVGNAATIISVGAQRGVPSRGWVIAVATAMQESSLRNLPGGDRDSVGLFQQRPSQGWGTPTQLLDPAYAAGKFYAKLLTVPGWQTMPLTDAAQAVQHSATPTDYADDEPDARTIVEKLAGAAELSCDVVVGPQGWVAPLRAPIVSGFRPPDRPTHNGVDLGAPRGTRIHAAAAGTVTVAACNVKPASYGCDRDGNPDVGGCGWYVSLNHGRGITTNYCHLLRRPTVAVGQTVAAGHVLGAVGSSGNSSGDHLHYEVRVRTVPTDPTAWMRAHGAALGAQ